MISNDVHIADLVSYQKLDNQMSFKRQLLIIQQLVWVSQSSIMSEYYVSISYLKVCIQYGSNALCNDHVIIVYVFIVHDCCHQGNVVSELWAVGFQYVLLKLNF